MQTYVGVTSPQSLSEAQSCNNKMDMPSASTVCCFKGHWLQWSDLARQTSPFPRRTKHVHTWKGPHGWRTSHAGSMEGVLNPNYSAGTWHFLKVTHCLHPFPARSLTRYPITPSLHTECCGYIAGGKTKEKRGWFQMREQEGVSQGTSQYGDNMGLYQSLDGSVQTIVRTAVKCKWSAYSLFPHPTSTEKHNHCNLIVV